MSDKKGFTPIESVMVLLLISAAIFLIVKKYNQLEFEANKTRAYMDIKNLNFVIKIYKYRYGKLPDSLYEIKKKNLLKLESTPVVSDKSFFKGKQLIDPFGNPYIYDNKTGKVNFSNNTLLLLKK